ncbi:NUMOD1 domain-containing DNA-binding protein, partial [Acidobacteriota bacterium]
MKTRKLKTRDQLKHAEILQFTRKGKFLREYSSMSEAANLLGINPIVLSRCLKGKQKTAGGYQWRPANDPSFKNGIVNIPPLETNRALKLQPVVQYNMEGKFVKEYPSVKEAAEILGISIPSILNCIRGKTKSANQSQWRLKKDAIKDGKIRNINPIDKGSPGWYRQIVCQFGLDGKFIREYPSIKEAARKMKVSYAAINQAITKKTKTIAGYQWRAKRDVIKYGKIRNIDPYSRRSPIYLRPVCQFRRDGTFIREYASITEAAEKLNISKYNISECVFKYKKTCHGFLWRLKDDVDKDGKIMDIQSLQRNFSDFSQEICQFDREGKF